MFKFFHRHKCPERKYPERLNKSAMSSEDKKSTMDILELYDKRNLTPELENSIIVGCERVSQQTSLRFGTYPKAKHFYENVYYLRKDIESALLCQHHGDLLARMNFDLIVDVFVTYRSNRDYYTYDGAITAFLWMYRDLDEAGFPYETYEEFYEIFKAMSWYSFPEGISRMIEGFERIRGFNFGDEIDEKSVQFADLCYFTCFDSLQQHLYSVVDSCTECYKCYSDDVIEIKISSSSEGGVKHFFEVKDNGGNVVADFIQHLGGIGPYQTSTTKYDVGVFEAGPWLKHLYYLCVRHKDCFGRPTYLSLFSDSLQTITPAS